MVLVLNPVGEKEEEEEEVQKWEQRLLPHLLIQGANEYFITTSMFEERRATADDTKLCINHRDMRQELEQKGSLCLECSRSGVQTWRWHQTIWCWSFF